MLSLLGTVGLIVVWLITWLMTFDGSKATDTTKALKSEMNDALKDDVLHKVTKQLHLFANHIL